MASSQPTYRCRHCHLHSISGSRFCMQHLPKVDGLCGARNEQGEKCQVPRPREQCIIHGEGIYRMIDYDDQHRCHCGKNTVGPFSTCLEHIPRTPGLCGMKLTENELRVDAMVASSNLKDIYPGADQAIKTGLCQEPTIREHCPLHGSDLYRAYY